MTADFKENIRSVAYRADQELLYLQKLRFTITAYQDEEQIRSSLMEIGQTGERLARSIRDGFTLIDSDK